MIRDMHIANKRTFASPRAPGLRWRLAFTIQEMFVVMIVVALLGVMIVPLLPRSRGGCGASLKDKSQIQQIHKGMLTFAGEGDGRLPLPGQFIRSKQVAGINADSVTDGDCSNELNHSASLYSMLIAQQYFNPELCFGPTEVNPRINVKSDYDFSAYRPSEDVFWDSTFQADVSARSNTSYAHLALCGERIRRHWSNIASPSIPLLSTRGTGGRYGGYSNGGAITGPDYDNSPTLELHGPPGAWDGHVCFADNHVETLSSFFAPLAPYPASGRKSSLQSAQDNIFAAEFVEHAALGPQAAGDAWLVLSAAADKSGNSITPVWDPLNP